MSSDDISVSGNTFTPIDGNSNGSNASTYTLPDINFAERRKKWEDPNALSDYFKKTEDNKSYTLENVDDPDSKEISDGDLLNPPDNQSSFNPQEVRERMYHRLEELARYENSLADTSERGDGNANGAQGEDPILTWQMFLEKVKKHREMFDSQESDK